jgi:hypothetical protein
MAHADSYRPPLSLEPDETGGRGATERWIDDELAQSFPASDPPSWTMGTAQPEEPRAENATERDANARAVSPGYRREAG